MTGKRVLVVEDEWLIAEQVAMDLSDDGLVVVGPAATVEAALGLIETDAPDVAMLDVNLGGVKSFPVARALAKRGIPFVFVSGYVRRDLPNEFAQAEMIGKPLVKARLGDAIQRLLNKNSA